MWRSNRSQLPSIQQYYSRVREGKIDSMTLLKKYALTENFEEAVRELDSFIDLDQLTALIAWLEENLESYKLEGFTIIRDPEFNEIMSIAIYIGNCNFEEWRPIVRSIKQKLLEEGFDDLVGSLIIVCIDVFKPRE